MNEGGKGSVKGGEDPPGGAVAGRGRGPAGRTGRRPGAADAPLPAVNGQSMVDGVPPRELIAFSKFLVSVLFFVFADECSHRQRGSSAATREGADDAAVGV